MSTGQGDRAPRSKWQRVTGPVDVVVLEGWCLVRVRARARVRVRARVSARVSVRARVRVQG